MERINSLKRNEVLRELKTYKKYTGNTEKDIVASLGEKDIQSLRKELERLESRRSVRKERSQKSTKKQVSKNIVYENPMHEDVVYNLLLNADPKSLPNLCSTNQKASMICKDKTFWKDKIQHDNFTILKTLTTIEEYKHYYYNMAKAGHIADIIIKMAAIEKEYDKTNPFYLQFMNPNDGTIGIYWQHRREDIIPPNMFNGIKDILKKAEKENNLEYFSRKIIITPNNNNYDVTYTMMDDEYDNIIDVTISMTAKEVKNLLTSFVYVTLTSDAVFIADKDEDIYYDMSDPDPRDMAYKYYMRLGMIKLLEYNS